MGKLVVDIVTLNWGAAAKSAMEVTGHLKRPRRSLARRATRRAFDRLSPLFEHEVSAAEGVEGMHLAKRAISQLSAEKYADLALEHGQDSRSIADAIIDASGAGTSSGAAATAKRILDITLTSLLAFPEFLQDVDRAVAWASARINVEEARRREASAHESVVTERIRREQFVTSLRRHSRTRAAALERQHEGRAFEGQANQAVRAQIRRPEAWRTSIGSDRKMVAEAVEELGGRRHLVEAISSINLRGAYDAVHLALQDGSFFLRALPEYEDLPVAAARALARLRRDVVSPRYRTAALLTGRWGAGKSRLLAEIAAVVSSQPSSEFLLRPSLGRNQGLEEAVLDEARAATGRDYMSLREFRRDLREAAASAVVVVDEADRFFPSREELDRTTQAMLDLTDDDRIRWVLTADSRHLDRVLSPESTERWERMSAVPLGTATVSAWTDLDSSEGGQCIGDALIRRELGLLPDMAESFAPLLKVPLNAWLFIDELRSAGGAQATISFDDVYWRTMLEGFTTTAEERRACQKLRAALAALFSASAGASIDRDAAFRATRGAREAIEDALGVLNDAHLIAFPADDVIAMDSPALWAGRIASSILESESRMEDGVSSQRLVAEVARFAPEIVEVLAMQVLVGVSEHAGEAALPGLVREMLDDDGIPLAAIWTAALADPRVHGATIRILRTAEGAGVEHRPARPHDEYLLLRLCEAEDVEFSFKARLRVIKPGYETIGANGLHVVLQQMLEQLSGTDVTSETERFELLGIADGIQRARSAEQFADEWVEAAASVIGADRTFIEADAFIREYAEYTRDEIAASGAYETGRPSTAPLALHLADAVVHLTARELGPEFAYDLFDSHSWFDEDSGRDGIGKELRRACQIGLGHRYSRDPEGVIDLLERLMRGDGTEQERAVFILRHTGPTQGRTEIRPPRELEHFVDRLNSSGRLDPAVKSRWIKPMLKAIRSGQSRRPAD